ncbi:hypothetical protein [Mucilaginibacter sp. FT3.2]|uniref:hypothetical protein n=1 Tax=Mucilaginibacter sp. FT3.2 TaxID=2723090 RepID=UPI0016115FF5|nr:hypothetical protein [Mucilaginibacter sp. FT3.2]MBB6230677.1 hypothetical protein [Mucilaginibacter sp. FT3.2]
MKKIFLLFSIIAYCLSSTAQTISFTTTATTVASGTVITIKAVGETASKYIMGIAYWGSSLPQYYGTIGGATFYNKVTGTPTSFTFTVTNNGSAPGTATYTFLVTPYDAVNFTSLPPVNASVSLVVNQAPPQPVPAPSEGDFVRNDDTGQVFWFFEGKIRYIPNQDVLHGLFTGYTDAIAKHYTTAQLNSISVQTGVPINPDNGLINDTNTGRVYFREANLVRWIRSSDAMNRYHFSWNSIKNRVGISGYVVGADIN